MGRESNNLGLLLTSARPLPTARIAAGGAREKVGGPHIRPEKIQKWGGLAGWLAVGLTKAHR